MEESLELISFRASRV